MITTTRRIALLCTTISVMWPTMLPAQIEQAEQTEQIEQTEQTEQAEQFEQTEQAEQTTLLFSSNAAGSRIQRIDPARRSEFRHVIEYERRGTREIERLFSDEVQKRRLERQTDASGFRVETEYREEQLYTTTRYDPEGRVSSEERYDEDGNLAERRNYTYLQVQNVQNVSGLEVSAFDSEGNQIYSETHSYTERGQLDEIERIYSDGSERLDSYTFVGDRLFEELQIVAGEGNLYRYDRNGRLIYREVLKDDEIIQNEQFDYGDNSKRRTPIRSAVTENNRFIERRYDEEGRIISAETRIDDTLIEESRFSYDAEDRRRETITRTGSALIREIEFDDAGEPLSERWVENGQILRLIRWSSPTERSEEHYRNGQPYVRIYYRGQDRLRDEFLSNGRIVRTRLYQTDADVNIEPIRGPN